MANSELCRHYLQKGFNNQKMPEVIYTNIIQALDQHFNYDWTYEVINEFPILDGTNITVTVQVYIPGRVVTGRCTCKSTEYGEAHLRAILDAVYFLIDEKTAYQNPPSEVQQNNGQMNADQIAAALNGQYGDKMVNTKEQFYNHTEQGVQADGVPMDKMTDNCHKELQEEMFPNQQQNNQQQPAQQQSAPQSTTPQAAPPMNPPQTPPDYDVPDPNLNGFTKRQVDGVNAFKKDFNIMDDVMFASWVQSWDQTMTNGRKSLTPQNVNNFLAYIDSVRKAQKNA